MSDDQRTAERIVMRFIGKAANENLTSTIAHALRAGRAEEREACAALAATVVAAPRTGWDAALVAQEIAAAIRARAGGEHE